MSGVVGCKIEPLDVEQARRVLKWVVENEQGLVGFEKLFAVDRTWLLAHCNGGVTWGRLKSDGWVLGSRVFPDLCPTPQEGQIQALRVFSREAEVYLWPTEQGLVGRLLIQDDADVAPELKPTEEEWLLMASRIIETKGDFTRVGDGKGSEQALPLILSERVDRVASKWPRLRVRHYFAEDEGTGRVYVRVTQLVEVVA